MENTAAARPAEQVFDRHCLTKESLCQGGSKKQPEMFLGDPSLSVEGVPTQLLCRRL